MDMTDLTGSVVALVTPFKKDGSVDFERLEGLVDFHLANGTDGVSAALPTLAQHATAQLDGGTCTAELQGNTLTATFERASGRQLMIELTLTDTSYKITKWKTATDWKEDKSETLWQG